MGEAKFQDKERRIERNGQTEDRDKEIGKMGGGQKKMGSRVY